LRWIWHKPGKQNGPVGVKIPKELGGTKTGKGGNKTQACVLQLLESLPKASYYLYIDNLFVSTNFLELLRSRGYACTGTCKTNSGVISELVELKKNGKGKKEIDLW
jgi:hypothetical protein